MTPAMNHGVMRRKFSLRWNKTVAKTIQLKEEFSHMVHVLNNRYLTFDNVEFLTKAVLIKDLLKHHWMVQPPTLAEYIRRDDILC